MTTGNQSGMAGGSVPLQGESQIRQMSSGVDLLTLTLASGATSTAAGRPFVIRKFVEAEDRSSGSVIFAVDALGNVSGGASGSLYAPVQVVADAATASAAGVGGWGSTSLTLTAAQAGKILTVPTASAAGGTVVLPAASGLALGTTYKFYFPAAAASSGVRITSSLSSSDDVVMPSGASGKAFQVTATGLQKWAYIEVVLVESKRWLGLPAASTAAVWSATGVAA